GRPAVPVDGVRRRRGPRLAPAAHRPPAARQGARDRPPALRGARGRPRPGRPAPRPQARERDGRRPRQGAHHRLRARRAGRAAALPGGDPLAAALAAGETPSPELVAAAGQAEGLSPRVAWTCLLVTAAGIAVFAMLSRPCSLLRLAPVDRSPAALEDRARDLVRTLAYDAKPADARVGFAVDSDYLQYVAQHDRSPHRW